MTPPQSNLHQNLPSRSEPSDARSSSASQETSGVACGPSSGTAKASSRSSGERRAAGDEGSYPAPRRTPRAVSTPPPKNNTAISGDETSPGGDGAAAVGGSSRPGTSTLRVPRIQPTPAAKKQLGPVRADPAGCCYCSRSQCPPQREHTGAAEDRAPNYDNAATTVKSKRARRSTTKKKKTCRAHKEQSPSASRYRRNR